MWEAERFQRSAALGRRSLAYVAPGGGSAEPV